MLSCSSTWKGALWRIFGQLIFRSSPLIVSALVLMQIILCLSPAQAQSEPLQAGEAFLTRFSGLINNGSGFILDEEGVVGSIYDISQTGAAPQGQKLDAIISRKDFVARDVGQVFGIAIDPQTADIYLSATSAYGLFRNADNSDWMAGMWGQGGGPGTIWKLPAANNYEPEPFADITLNGRSNSGAALGNMAIDAKTRQIYVSDLETGMIHRLSLDGTELGRYDHGLTGRPSFTDQSGENLAALDPVAFNPATMALVASCPFGVFAQTPGCWNYADFRRRVYGLAVRKDANTGASRLFYSVWGSQSFGNPAWASASDAERKNSVWSIGLAADGSFDLADIRLEALMPDMQSDPADLATKGPSHPISDIAFPVCKAPDTMLLSERAGIRTTGLGGLMPPTWLNESRLLRYSLPSGNPSASWQLDGHHDVGFPQRSTEPLDRANDLGGVSFGYGYDASGNLDKSKPDAFIWTSGDQLCNADNPCFDPATGAFTDISIVDGMQGFSSDVPTGPFPADPSQAAVPANAYMLDADGDVTMQQLGLIGDVEIFQQCGTQGWGSAIIVPDAPWWDPGPWPDWPDPVWPDEPYPDLELTKVPLSPECIRGQVCSFSIRVANVGTEVFTGPLYVTDSLPAGTTFVGNSAPWNCALPGPGAHIACYHPPVTLVPGASVELRINVFVTASPNFNQNEIENCARIRWMMDLPPNTLVIEAALALAGYPVGPIDGVIDPATIAAIQQYQFDHGLPVTGIVDEALRSSLFGGAFGTADVNPANDRDCAIVPVIRPMPIPRAAPPIAPPITRKPCPPGWIGKYQPNCRKPEMRKPCPPGWIGKYQPNCRKPEMRKPCPPGWIGKYQPNCRKPEVRKPCPPGWIGKYQPNCRKPEMRKPCPPGWIGKYQPNCRKPEMRKPCPPGTIGKFQPNCKKVVRPKPCPPGTIGKFQPNCKKVVRPKPCPPGTIGKFQPNCKKVVRPKPCPPGTIGKFQPNCKKVVRPKPCPPGTIGKFQPNCKKVVRPKPCPPGTIGKFQPNCKKVVRPKPCPPGTIGKFQPNCKKVVRPKPCPPGTVGRFQPNCKKVTRPKPGILVPPKVKIIPGAVKIICPKGQVAYKGRCIKPVR